MARPRFFIAFVLLLALPAAAAPESDLWAFWDKSDSQGVQAVDHSAWAEFLQRYVTPGDDGINWVDYSAVRPADRGLLDGYVRSLAALDPRTLTKRAQFAYWVNLYNALTIQVVLDNPDESSILKMGKGFFSLGPWDMDLITLAGQQVTLNDIEHRILRPIWNDHRIHYAVNCASIGCPNLAVAPYRAETVEAMLVSSERDYINHPRGVTFDSRGRLQLSKIFDWYGEDFAPNEEALVEYLSKHHDSLSDRLRNYDGRIKYEYDWSLNIAGQ